MIREGFIYMLEKAEALLQHYYGYPSLRPGQKKAIQSVVSEKRDTACIMPTGGGNQSATKFLRSLWRGQPL